MVRIILRSPIGISVGPYVGFLAITYTVERPFFRFTARSKSPFLPHLHGFLVLIATLTSVSGILFEIERAKPFDI